MERRSFIKQATATAALAGVTAIVPLSCSTGPGSSEKDTGNTLPEAGNKEVIAHYVLFWLKKELSEHEITDFTSFFEELKSVPGIKSLHYGRPAATNPRPVVDNTFTYNLLVYFDSMEDIHIYETDPGHLAASAKYAKFWDKVVVHDSIINR